MTLPVRDPASATWRALAATLLLIVVCDHALAAQPDYRASLKASVAQLAQDPADDLLRTQVIDIAREIKPAPAVPAEVPRREGKAEYFVAHAAGAEDYLNAVKEYDAAIVLAPWLARLYRGRAAVLEMVGDNQGAIRDYNWYLLAAPAAADAEAVNTKIGMLQAASEQAAAKKKEDSRIQERMDAVMTMLAGNFREISCRMEAGTNGVGGYNFRGCTESEARGLNWRTTLQREGANDEICRFERRDVNDIRLSCPSYAFKAEMGRLVWDPARNRALWQQRDSADGEWRWQWTSVDNGYLEVRSNQEPDDLYGNPGRPYFRSKLIRID